MRSKLALAVVAALTWAGSATLGLAQSAPGLEPLFNATTRNPAIIRGQLSAGLASEERALEALRTAADPSAFGDAANTMYEGYIKLRFAVSGIRQKLSLSKYVEDPLWVMTAEQIDSAMGHIREAHLAARNVAAGDSTQITRALEELERALIFTQQAVDLF